VTIGQLDDLEARPVPGAWPLSDDDGHSMRPGQPGQIVNQEQGFAMSEMEIIEQEHRARLLRGGEELAHGHEPALACRGQLSVEGPVKFGAARGRDRIEQPGILTGHLAENLGDARVGTAAGRRRSGQADGERLAAGGLRHPVEQLGLSRSRPAADLDRRPDTCGDIVDCSQYRML
jgi:hypothetical protein